MKTIDIECVGYSVKTDVYEGSDNGPILLSLIGRTSNRKKRQYANFFPRIAEELGVTTVIFDYSGHGDSPFKIDNLRPAQHFLEVITVFDWIKNQYPNRRVFVIGSSYGGFMATQLTKYRAFDALLLRAPAIYPADNFYTKLSDHKRILDSIESFRHNKIALSEHPLLARASKFKGNVLVLTHEDDKQIPREVTDAYRNAFHCPELVFKGLPHSLDDASHQQVEKYLTVLYDWLKSGGSASVG